MGFSYTFLIVCGALALACAVPSVPLFNAAQPGMTMPIMGIGTGGYGNASGWGGEHWNDTVAEAAVDQFLRVGGRRIDTSLLYYTQIGCGLGWMNSGVPRNEIFITSKCDSPTYGSMIPGGYNETFLSVQITLKQLQTSYVDLMLIHWPGLATAPKSPPPCWQPPNNWKICRAETWRALEELFRSGVVRAIGVSNYESNHIQEIIDMGGLLPSVNQFEYHPYWHTDELVSFCKQHNIQVNGYAPLGTPDHMAFYPDKMPVLLPQNEVVMGIARKVGRTPAQVLLQWEINNGFVVNPRTEDVEHMKENIAALDFTLSQDDITSLFHIDNPPENVCGDPHLIP